MASQHFDIFAREARPLKTGGSCVVGPDDEPCSSCSPLFTLSRPDLQFKTVDDLSQRLRLRRCSQSLRFRRKNPYWDVS
jgi:hypothetical protein